MGIWRFDITSSATRAFVASQIGVQPRDVSHSLHIDSVVWVEPQLNLFDDPYVHRVSREDIADMLVGIYPVRGPCNSSTTHQIGGMQEVA
jgi:hypothetical protein